MLETLLLFLIPVLAVFLILAACGRLSRRGTASPLDEGQAIADGLWRKGDRR